MSLGSQVLKLALEMEYFSQETLLSKNEKKLLPPE